MCRSVTQSISGNVDSSQVTESDLLGWIRLILPAVNLALKKASEVFSGDPATTLKVRSFCYLGDYLLLPLHSAVLGYLKRFSAWRYIYNVSWFTLFQVAAVLLFFAKVGSGISIWSFIRFGACII